jgi:hypothetical protein
MDLWWHDSDGDNCITGKNACSSGTSYTKNITWTDLGSNPGLRGEGIEKNIDISGGSDSLVELIFQEEVMGCWS